MLGKKLTLGAVGNNQQAGDGTDADFDKVTLLVQADSTVSGTVSNALDNAVDNNIVIGEVADAGSSAFSPYGSSWSVDMGSEHYDLPTNTTSFDFGSGDFTIEGWIKLPSSYGTGYQCIFSTGYSLQIYAYADTVQAWASDNGSSYNIINTLAGPTANLENWTHFALVRNGSTFKVYINGVGGTAQTNSNAIYNENQPGIGVYNPSPSSYRFSGKISDLRIVKGTAVYTSNFTPPTSKLTAISGTTLLCCNGPRMIDESNDANVISRQGTNAHPKISPDSPFPDTEYHNGSVQLDGVSDYVRLDDPSGDLNPSSSMCMEAWFYMTAAPANNSTGAHCIISHWDGSSDPRAWLIDTGNNLDFRVYVMGSGGSFQVSFNGVGSFNLNEWTHVALTWDGSTYRFFVNGSLIQSSNSSVAPNSTTSRDVLIGYNTNDHFFPGYIADVRLTIDGGAIYTSNFTPPSSPLTAVTGTQVLTAQKRGRVRRPVRFNDELKSNSWIGEGNLGLGSFSPFSKEDGKWGIFFRSNDSYKFLSRSYYQLNGYDFTIEFWFWPAAGNSNSVIAAHHNGSGDANLNWLFRQLVSSGDKLRFVPLTSGGTPTEIDSTDEVNIRAWNHVAVTSDGTNLKMWLNGAYQGAVSFDGTLQSNVGPVQLGGWDNNYWAGGYLSNFRIVRGSVLYSGTSSITVPTDPLTAVTNTVLLTAQSNTKRDNSSYNDEPRFVSGDPAVTTFSPFKNSVPYDPSTMGGSVYFDNNGARVRSTPNNFEISGTEEYTVEFWAYPTSASRAYYCDEAVGTGNYTVVALTPTGGTVEWYHPDAGHIFQINGVREVIQNTWVHIRICRNSIGEHFLYVNGKYITKNTANNTTDFFQQNDFLLGDYGGGGYSIHGYVHGWHVCRESLDTGTSNFAIPTSIATRRKSTSMLLNFGDAGAYDATGGNSFMNYNQSRVTTAEKKYGEGSLYFDGTSDYMVVPAHLAHITEIEDSNFTVEFWLKGTVNDSYNVIIAKGQTGDTPNSSWWMETVSGTMTFYVSTGTNYIFAADTSSHFSNAGSTSDGWVHYAGVFNADDGYVELYANGSRVRQVSFGANNTNYTEDTDLFIGGHEDLASASVEGYVDDIRITKGVRRYTGASYTIPSAKFSKQ